MSEMNQPQPIDYAYADTRLRVPTSVKVLAIIGIIWAAMAIICSPLGMIPYIMKLPPPADAIINSIKSDGALFGTIILGTALSFLLGIVLLIGSVGSLFLKRFAWMTMVVYAMLSIVFCVVWTAANVAFITPRVNALTQQAGQPPSNAQMIMGVAFGALAIVYQVCVLIFYSRPHVKNAFVK